MIYEIFVLLALGISMGLAWATVWSRRETCMRIAAVLMFLALMPTVGSVAFFALGHPAPWVQTLTVPGGEYRVLGMKLVQDVAIYVLMDFVGGHPRYFSLPWSNSLADKLQDMSRAQNEGEIQGFNIFIPYDSSLDDNEIQVHPSPQPKAIPEKEPQTEAPTLYDRGYTGLTE